MGVIVKAPAPKGESGNPFGLPDLCTPSQLAVALGLSAATVRRLANKGGSSERPNRTQDFHSGEPLAGMQGQP